MGDGWNGKAMCVIQARWRISLRNDWITRDFGIRCWMSVRALGETVGNRSQVTPAIEVDEAVGTPVLHLHHKFFIYSPCFPPRYSKSKRGRPILKFGLNKTVTLSICLSPRTALPPSPRTLSHRPLSHAYSTQIRTPDRPTGISIPLSDPPLLEFDSSSMNERTNERAEQSKTPRNAGSLLYVSCKSC